MSNSEKIIKLKALLLEEDRASLAQIEQELAELKSLVNKKKKLAKKVAPILEERLEQFEKDIPQKMGPAITAALKVQISESQNEVVDLLYPIIGKLISKFIRIEIQRLSEKIDAQLSNMFSFKGIFKRFKNKLSGTSESEMILRDTALPVLEEMFIVEKGSGILLDSYSRNQTIDQDMIAGMMTAIKAFVEDAFDKGAQELEVIEYESYKIRIFNFQTYYIAMVISGIVNAEFLLYLQNSILQFSDKYKGYQTKNEDSESPEVELLLKDFFDEQIS